MSLEFEKLGWGPVSNAPQDLGIDLFVHARLEQHDPGLVVGVQVKSGKSSFREPACESGEMVGWWHRDRDKRHFDYWVTHGLPILLVLHDLVTGKSYWVHVTQEGVVSTGKGAKILVRRSQTINESSVDALMLAAAQLKAVPEFEGSAFTFGIDRIASARHWRYALIVPRLIAPNPYKQIERPIDAVEAVALLARGRFDGLRNLSEAHVGIPDPECVPDDAGWGWQFVGAIWDWATKGSLDGLKSVQQSAPDWQRASASGVLLACGLSRQERHSEAVAVLDGLTLCEDNSPVDRGWVLVQRARIHTDLGDFDAARSDAIEAHRIFFADRDDPTVSALKASAAWVIYVTSEVVVGEPELAAPASEDEFKRAQHRRETAQREALRSLLVASDTTVSWWRSQHVALALSREQDSSFESWTDDDPRTYLSGPRMPETELFAAELNADVTGEHRTWRALSGRRGQQTLMRAASSTDETGQLAEGIDDLRRSGDSRRLTQAVGRLVRTGPLKPLVAAMNKIPTEGWTRTTALANFEALALAGDLIGEASADVLLDRCARAACGDTTDLGCTTGEGYMSLEHYGIQAAAGLLPAASDAMHTRLAGYLARLPEVEPAFFRRGVERALNYLDYEHVDHTDRAALRGLAVRGDARLSAAVYEWFESSGDPDAIGALKQAALEGDAHALSAITNDTVFDDCEATALIEALEKRVQQIHSDALAGRWSSGSPRYCYELTRWNLLFPNAARWHAVVDLLGAQSAVIEDKRAICDALATLPSTLAPEIRNRIAPLIDTAVANSKSFLPGSGTDGTELLLKNTLELIEGEELDAAVTRLVFGSHAERRDASVVLRRANCANRYLMLKVLTHDTTYAVRRSAAVTVGYLAASDSDDAAATIAWEMAHSDGRQLPLALVRGISMATNLAQYSSPSDITEFLTEHSSAIIRTFVNLLHTS